MDRRHITIEGTRFIFRTNFAGDPEADRFRSSQRKGNIIIPDEGLARELLGDGFNIKQTRPKEGEEDGFEPTYFASVIVNFDSMYPPRVFLLSGDSEAVRLDADSIGIIDRMRIKNVDIVLNPREYEEGKFTLYVRTMYVEQDLDDDPFASKYADRFKKHTESEEPPFEENEEDPPF